MKSLGPANVAMIKTNGGKLNRSATATSASPTTPWICSRPSTTTPSTTAWWRSPTGSTPRRAECYTGRVFARVPEMIVAEVAHEAYLLDVRDDEEWATVTQPRQSAIGVR
jgi:hypothetical protein